MGIERVQKGSPGYAVWASFCLEPGGIIGTRVATDDVVSTAARVIRIVDTKLSVIKNIKGLSSELYLAGLADLEMFQQRHVEVQAPGIIQEIPARVPESESARSHKLGRIPYERAKAPRVGTGRE